MSRTKGRGPRELDTAVMAGDLAVVQQLLADGADPKAADRSGMTPLHLAAVYGKPDVAQALCAVGARPDAVDQEGATPLHYAARENLPEIVSLLLKSGAPVDARDQYGNTPLWRAVFASRGRGDVIALLLAAGANPGVKNDSEMSPRDLAKTIANYDVARFLP